MTIQVSTIALFQEIEACKMDCISAKYKSQIGDKETSALVAKTIKLSNGIHARERCTVGYLTLIHQNKILGITVFFFIFVKPIGIKMND